MAIVFKVLKYKHQKQAMELNRHIDAGEADDDEILQFVVSLVDKWSFVDEETNEPLDPADPACIDELSIEQYGELMFQFNTRMGAEQTIPKTNGEQSPSGLTKSKAKRKSQPNRQSGSMTLSSADG